jgi:hypothetical protein
MSLSDLAIERYEALYVQLCNDDRVATGAALRARRKVYEAVIAECSAPREEARPHKYVSSHGSAADRNKSTVIFCEYCGNIAHDASETRYNRIDQLRAEAAEPCPRYPGRSVAVTTTTTREAK